MSVALSTEISVCTDMAAPAGEWVGVNPLESQVKFPWHGRCSQ
jgi:hypothetical protein